MAVSINLRSVWVALKATISVLYKAAFLLLAYQFVVNTTGFYGFCMSAARAFYALGQHPGVGT